MTPNELLPLVYSELRKLAAARMACEKPGHTLSATALVHEVWLRLADSSVDWQDRSHFLRAAATAMRRILVDRARARNTAKRGGENQRLDVDPNLLAAEPPDESVEALDGALTRLTERHPLQAELVQLRYFGGLTLEQCAEALGVSARTADTWWAYARAWLTVELSDHD